jgi:hypothetical protein
LNSSLYLRAILLFTGFFLSTLSSRVRKIGGT